MTALLLVLGLLLAACAPADDVTAEESSDDAPVAEEAATETADDQTAQRTAGSVIRHP